MTKVMTPACWSLGTVRTERPPLFFGNDAIDNYISTYTVKEEEE